MAVVRTLLALIFLAGCAQGRPILDSVPCSAVAQVRDPSLLGLPQRVKDDLARNNRSISEFCR